MRMAWYESSAWKASLRFNNAFIINDLKGKVERDDDDSKVAEELI